MLPHALERAERPPKSLFREIPESVGSLGQCYRIFFVANSISKAPHGDGEILILSQRVRRETADPFQNFLSPSTHGPGDNSDAVKRREGPPVVVLRGDILQCLPLSDNIDPISDLGV